MIRQSAEREMLMEKQSDGKENAYKKGIKGRMTYVQTGESHGSINAYSKEGQANQKS